MKRGRKPKPQPDTLPPRPRHIPEEGFGAELLKTLDDGFTSLRKTYGLSSRTIGLDDVYQVLPLQADPDPEAALRNPDAVPHAISQARAVAKLNELRAAVRKGAAAGGVADHATPNIGLVQKGAPGVLEALLAGRIGYKEARRKLEEKLPRLQELGLKRLPTERTLRRWLAMIGH